MTCVTARIIALERLVAAQDARLARLEADRRPRREPSTAALSLLATVFSVVAGHAFASIDIVALAAATPRGDLAVALEAARIGSSARRLGKFFERHQEARVGDAVLQRVGEDARGVIWDFVVAS